MSALAANYDNPTRPTRNLGGGDVFVTLGLAWGTARGLRKGLHTLRWDLFVTIDAVLAARELENLFHHEASIA